MLACIRDKTQIEGQIMDAGYLHGQQFLCLEEMMQIGLGVDTVYLTTIRINRGKIVFPFLVPHIHRALIGEKHGVSPVSGWHHTVEHIDASLDGFEDILRCTDAHQVAGSVFRQNIIHHLNHLIHYFGRFAYGQSADGCAATIVQT